MACINPSPFLCFQALPPSTFLSRPVRTFRSILTNRPTIRQTSQTSRAQTRSCINIPVETSSNVHNILQKAATSSRLDSSQIDSLLALTDLVLDVNKQFNLTGIRTRDAIIQKHIVDGLTLLPFLDQENVTKIIDVGTGAGFPGLVLAIARPHWHLTLLDSAKKKTRFHDMASEKLSLENVTSVWARAEEAGQDANHRERYHVAIARSVAEMRELAELCLPLVSVKGCFMAQKSIDASRAEINGAGHAFKTLGGSLESVTAATPLDWVDGDEGDGREKAIVIVRKKSRTPAKYPRLPGAPKKAPL